PQERLFLKACWEVFEDAGYTKARLKQTCDGRVGVFAGITKTGYELYGPQLWQRGETVHPNTSFSSLANRVSYLFDFKGPSLPVDTMCSSSLTAIHEACEHLYRGECEMAVAGGVNLYLHPSSYVRLCSLRMLTTGNKNKSFGKGGDGFLPGEGGGAVLLKPLNRALADGDPIHAVIRGTGINHGGRTGGYTIPSPMAQAELIRAVMDKAGVTAREISYVETHGTGTELGDPIEISGLVRAFGGAQEKDTPCAIGSAKSNIGHLEASAGIAGLTKIILQMQHGQIAPSLHARQLNPNIDFHKTPFAVQQTIGDWIRPEIEGKTIPRIAGLSSFGAGGANAHIIVEEFLDRRGAADQGSCDVSGTPVIFVLSARTGDRLTAYARRMNAWLDGWMASDPDTRPTLADITYTLQTGREPMRTRLAVIADSAAGIREKLARYIAGEDDIADVYQGSVKGESDTAALFRADEDLQDAVGAWVAKGKYGRLLDFWVKGLDVDWDLLYEGRPAPKRISLPTYPFAEERYWPVETYNLHTGNPHVFQPSASPIVTGVPQEIHGPLMTFEEFLCEGPVPEDTPAVNRIKSLVCILEKAEYRDAVEKSMKRLSPDTRVAFLNPGAKSIDWEKGFSDVLKDEGSIDAVLYMAVLEDPKAGIGDAGIVSCIKAMAAAKLGDVRFLLAARLPDGPERCYPESWIGFERSLGLVMPRMQSGVVLDDSDGDDTGVTDGHILGHITGWTERLWKELHADRIESVVYKDGKRYVYRIRPTDIPAEEKGAKHLIKPDHTYLITGGCGGLGALFARHLAKKCPINLILTGRSALDEDKKTLLREIGSVNPGVRAAYIQADICDKKAMAEELAALGKDFGPIFGVIHAAGIQDSTPITEKDIQAFNDTLGPKVQGTLALDEVLTDEPLEFACYFSSAAAVLGDFGWCDYAVGNRFLAAFGEFKRRRGTGPIPLVMHWPLWKEGGMGFDTHGGADTYLKSSGQRLLETDEALALFDRLLSGTGGQHLVLAGDPSRIHRFLGLEGDAPDLATGRTKASAVQGKLRESGTAGGTIRECLEQDIKKSIGDLLAIPAHQLDTDVNLAEFGFDSITLTEFGGWLSDFYDVEVSPAIFFEINTIERLVAVFLDNHEPVVLRFYGEAATDDGAVAVPAAATPPGRPPGMPSDMRFHSGAAQVPFQYGAGDVAAWTERYPECVPLGNVPPSTVSASGVPLNGGNTKKPCFWIHPLTGSVEPYLKIARGMDADQPFFGIRAKGFGTERGFLGSIPQMAQYYIDIISGIDPAGPYQLAGFSMGGVIAQEMARLLQAQGKEVATLLLLEPPFPAGDVAGKPVEEIALDRDTILTTANFFLYAHARKILDPQVAGAKGEKTGGEALIEYLASRCVEEGVRQSAALIGHTIKNMCEAFAHNKRALAAHTVSPLPYPERVAVHYFTQPDDVPVTSEGGKSGERQVIHDGTRKLLGEKLTHDHTHYRKWQALLPGMKTVWVPSGSHFDFLSDRAGLDATIEACRSIYRNILNQTGGISSLQSAGAKRVARMTGAAVPGHQPRSQAVAIVGMSGRFPQARDLDEFWRRLHEGRDCITEIPKDRWDWRAIYGDPLKAGNRTNVKWGGFMDGVGNFDPMFFGIAPREAEWMDPMQRLLMLYTWKAVEDAGYAARGLAGSNTGMFIGTGGSGYLNRLYPGGPDLEGYYGTAVLPAMGPNRMSYFMGLHGPSEPVDTTCSSSLVAICRAVDAIENGTCDAAVAGGVNLIVDPAFHISLDRLGMLSKEGRCRTFSSRADGYVRGEGVGMLFLKSLHAAEQDKDHIYGVIRGSAVNHGGKANSLTAPNPRAQVAVLTDAYEKAGIDPGTVGYIEAHGTGTVLGDPIEIDALKTAFKRLTQDVHRDRGSKAGRTGYCGLGSVKTNIGHLELAAGVAGVIKVLLQLKHKTIVKSLHCDTLNPHIKLEGSPFYISDTARNWEPPRMDTPRRAGVSAFGAGGVNAHVVLEEYRHKVPEKDNSLGEIRTSAPAVFVLSARDEARLKAYAITMADFLDSGLEKGLLPDVADIAYTSQVGRDAMEERLAVLAGSAEELRDKLKAFGRDGHRSEGVFCGNVKQDKDTLALFTEDDDFGALLDKWVRNKNYRKLLSLWAKGMAFNWDRLYQDVHPRRVSLPTYPFAQDRYWIEDRSWIESRPAAGHRRETSRTWAAHPLLHENTSDLTEQRFSSVFKGDASFLADYGELKVLSPGVQLEMARAAAIRSAGNAIESSANVTLKNVTWIKPLAVGSTPVETHIGLFPEQGGDLMFEIYIRTADGDDTADVYTSGTVGLGTESTPSSGHEPVVDMAAVTAECDREPKDFPAGNGSIRELHLGKDVALARLVLPPEFTDTADVFDLHPALIDAAFHAARGLADDEADTVTPAFELDRLEVYKGCLAEMWAVIRCDKANVHVDLCDENGAVRIRMQGFRALQDDVRIPATGQAKPVSHVQEDVPTRLLTFEEYLDEKEIDGASAIDVKTLLCILNGGDDRAQVAGVLKDLAPDTKSVIISAADDYEKVITGIIQEHSGLDAVLYMADGDVAARVARDIHGLLQAMAAADITAQVRFLLAAQLPEGPAFCHGDSWVGFQRSLPMIMPKLHFGVISRQIAGKGKGVVLDTSQWLNILWQELHAERMENAVYQGDQRYVFKNRETGAGAPQSFDSLIKPGKTYVITGGCGGLGGLLARYLAGTYDIHLILTGRSPENEKIRQLLEDLGNVNRSAKITYVQADICDADAVAKGISAAGKDVKPVAGVIHAAGIESDGDLLGKDKDAFSRVLRPKIDGCLALEEAFGDKPLDFICSFSSTSAVLGDFGACDYAIANRFMAAFARYKNRVQSK
ncbi:MAG TPA: hypothetical protein DHV36_23045, partial [Desulfobacteraceae bacterium]|nr:hypothetical protein [Desulfobacteraceae bacterium]